ncbi:ester cyclase [Deltaproteobacteria bacterium TL4]
MKLLKCLIITIVVIGVVAACSSSQKPYVFSVKNEPASYTSSDPLLEQNKEIALEVSKSIMNGDWDKLDSFLATEFVYDGDRLHLNKDEYMGSMQDLYLAMRDMKMEFLQVYAEGEFVTVRFENSMKNLGSFMGGPATGKTLVAEGIFIRQIRNGKVIKENQTTDILGLMTQMGSGALFGYSTAVGLLDIAQDRPVRKTTEEMKKLDAEIRKEESE